MTNWVEVSPGRLGSLFWKPWNLKSENVEVYAEFPKPEKLVVDRVTYGNSDISTLGFDHSVVTGWRNKQSGIELVLISDGSWRYPSKSRFRLLERDGSNISDISYLISEQNDFDASKEAEGSASFNTAFSKCKAVVEDEFGI